MTIAWMIVWGPWWFVLAVMIGVPVIAAIASAFSDKPIWKTGTWGSDPFFKWLIAPVSLVLIFIVGLEARDGDGVSNIFPRVYSFYHITALVLTFFYYGPMLYRWITEPKPYFRSKRFWIGLSLVVASSVICFLFISYFAESMMHPKRTSILEQSMKLE